MAEVRLAGKQEQDVSRPLAKFPPDGWNYNEFLSFANVQVPESYVAELEVMKEKVKHTLLDSTSHFVEKVNLINTLCRLGLSYHFEAEIEDQIKCIWVNQQDLLIATNYDLNTTALLFRVFRQHGFKISSDALFNKLKDSNGKLKEDHMMNDVKGILSLYEATYLSIHGEEFLDEVRNIAVSKLESLAIQASPDVAEHIRNFIKWPSQLSLNRLEARQYISFYEKNDETKNELLLRFAKLDFNVVQLVHQNELSQLLRWWQDTNLASDIYYARHRPVEAYFWSNGVYFEPQYSRARLMLTKSLIFSSLLNDTYDAFGKLEELQRFTDAVKRLEDCSYDLDRLPDYMKPLYKALLKFMDELKAEFSKEGRLFCIHYEMEGLKQLVESYHTKAQWFNDGYVAPFEEYTIKSLNSSGFPRLTISALLGMGEIAGIKEFEWVFGNPKCGKALQTIGRFNNDIVSLEHESQRGHAATGVECYVKQYGTSAEEAKKILRKLAADSWKDINEDCMNKPIDISKPILMVILNFSRTMDFFYKFEDGYTCSNCLRDFIISLLIDPIPMED